jgi:hypothetical protein
MDHDQLGDVLRPLVDVARWAWDHLRDFNDLARSIESLAKLASVIFDVPGTQAPVAVQVAFSMGVQGTTGRTVARVIPGTPRC